MTPMSHKPTAAGERLEDEFDQENALEKAKALFGSQIDERCRQRKERSTPDGLKLLNKIRFHLGGTKNIDFLVGIKAMEVTTPGYDQVKLFREVSEIGNRAHSFMVGVMAFQPEKPHFRQFFQ